MTDTAHTSNIAQLIVDAGRHRQPIAQLSADQVPVDAAGAYALQQDILRLRGCTVGGWKIGSKSHTGPVQGAPLPTECLLPSGANLERAAYFPPGLELEIAFRFNRDFAPRADAYSDEEVRQGIGYMAATIELVASRFAVWPKVEPLLQLGDLLNHGALIVGEFVEYRENFPFAEPEMTFTYAGQNIVPGKAANPAGDPRRLLAWLVNHHTGQGLTLSKDTVITAGSFTGMYIVKGPGLACGEITGLPAVSLSLF
ncbi:2-keto-4-pentenoate hydratase [Pseudomonas sp. CCI3.2]|uniref:2-keto-4-pentenoate hydratase n=1 Tax=unclassified Pseudomonas TaxID=196821 RepID=UPI002AC95769|nr:MULTISPECIES: 2-keto-4-pentenoate hydratase [unclassified Pseudomonas]MEB0077165.1 2-keto-4-pentenoate hydratase [Pseudomonas sp. MH10out]MEB0093037.1 2-keto-4-pentenoate hydratase [Pseudomonas sp. CCI4.2]MEB0102240.1 2-keto-4-pentenoate hydratase [Pseudomonas sp. CCI3.2]MEB0129372.1 2-keto-4-pentenoate hydratase [Pseudomonas sp. CCI2.4]MEB0158774.1 2-keto-4-pentenoate hydratase [Pseudomonas sp. AH2 (2023)]